MTVENRVARTPITLPPTDWKATTVTIMVKSGTLKVPFCFRVKDVLKIYEIQFLTGNFTPVGGSLNWPQVIQYWERYGSGSEVM